MTRSLRGSQFRRGSSVGEDVNPSAYIVNLADCMLVLALGCLVALVGAFNIDLNTTKLDKEDLEKVDPTEIDEELTAQGSYYVEAGTVYLDPNTGELFMIQNPENGIDLDGSANAEQSSANAGASESAAAANGASSGSASSGAKESTSEGSARDDDAVRNARANGAD